VNWLEEYLGSHPPPKYPFPIDQQKALAGKLLFEKTCARCHAGERVGRRVPVDEVGTDRSRLDTWSLDAAVAANKIIQDMGIERNGMVEEPPNGYIAPFLDGIWLRAPYLHNGSVPTLHALLDPPEKRPKVFYRGYDLYDPIHVGFESQGEEAKRVGTRFDVAQKGNGHEGHDYGTTLSSREKNALVEYLKTL
jgi:hypothetical protein